MDKLTVPTEAARDFFRCISAIADECKMEISREGLKVSAVDAEDVAMISTTMPQSPGLEKYDGERKELGIDVKNISEVLDEIMDPETEKENREDQIKISVKESSGITYLVIEHGGYTEELRCYDVESIRKIPKVPLSFTTEAAVRIRTKRFLRLIKKAEKVADYIYLNLSSEGEKPTLTATAGDGSDPVSFSADITLALGQIKACNIKSLFSLDYMHDLVSSIPSQSLELGLGDNAPCTIKFSLDNGGEAQFILSPRVEK